MYLLWLEEKKKQWQHQLQQKKCTFHPHEKKIFGISSSQHSSASSLSSPDVLSVVFLTSHILKKKKWYKNKDGRCEWMHRHKSFMSWSIHKKIKKEGGGQFTERSKNLKKCNIDKSFLHYHMYKQVT